MDENEIVRQIPIAELHPFPEHPFKVRDDDSMNDTVKSIQEYGVLVPIIVKPMENGNGYEIISGHRRKRACELAGIESIPAIVRNVDDDAATIIMVDSNIQRENILPSERAAAYKMKLEAIKRQGLRTDLTSSHVETKLRADEKIAFESGDSRAQVQRYIRLTQLTPELQQMVDEKKIGLTPAVELSYLKPDEQKILLDTIESEQSTPSLAQAKRLKEMSQSEGITSDKVLSVLSEPKKPEKNEIIISCDTLSKYFPKSYTPHQMERMIYKLLESWQKKKLRQQGER